MEVVVVVDLLLTNIVRIQAREFLPEGSLYLVPPPLARRATPPGDLQRSKGATPTGNGPQRGAFATAKRR